MPSTPIVSRPSARPTPPGSAARLLNVIVDPAAAFDGIGVTAPWSLAFAAIVLLRFVSLFVFYQPSVTPVKLVGGVAFQIATIAPLVIVASLVVWIASTAWGARVRWAAAFSIATHTCFAYTLATIAAASIAGSLLPASVAVDLRSPPFTNLAWLAGDSAGRLTRALLGELDIRSAYAVALVWIGLRGATPAASRAVTAGVVTTVVGLRLAAVVGTQLLGR